MATRKAEVAAPSAGGAAVAVRRTPPPLEIEASDVRFARIKKGEHMSAPVQEGLVPAGCIFTATSKDDGDPQIVLDPGDTEGILIHVLGMRRGRSGNDENGEWRTWAYDDPSAPESSFVTYDYTVVAPEIDTTLPLKILFNGQSVPTAKQLNMVLAKHREDPWTIAFRVWLKPSKNKKGSFFVYQIRQVVPETAKAEKVHAENVAVAEGLLDIVSQAAERFDSAPAADVPAI